MHKILSAFFLFGVCLSLSAQQGVDVRIVENHNQIDCNNAQYCVDVQLKNTNNGATLLGNSSIRFNYNAEAILFNGKSGNVNKGTFSSVNFDENSTCGNIHPYDKQSFDGLIPGDFLISLLLFNAFSQDDCSAILTKDWISASTVCFDVVDSSKDPNIQIRGTQNGPSNDSAGTNFNQSSNDPQKKMENGSFAGLNKSFDEVCKSTNNTTLTSLGSDWAIVSVQPVPVKENLMLQLNSNTSDEVVVQIFDLSGKLMTEQKTKVQSGLNQISMDVNQLAAGAYLISISKNQEMLAQKFIKE